MTNETVNDDDPSVIGGASDPPPMPTEEERRKFEWGARFVKNTVTLGVLDQSSAESLFLAGIDDWDYEQSPEDALRDEMEYWEADDDLA